MTFHVIHVTDTHLSVRHGHFATNVAAVERHIRASTADLVISTGDATMNGAGEVEDLDLAQRWHAGLGRPVKVVPGNHDIGDLPAIRAEQPIDDARIAAFRTRLGDDFWSFDVEDWRLIGLDAMLFGSGHAEEERQFAWLADVAETDRRIALFLHKPLFVVHAGEGPRGYWSVKPEPRARVLAALDRADLGLVASGHLHIAHHRTIDGVAHVWGPSAAFVCGPMQEDLGGDRVIGVAEYAFSGREVACRFVRPEGVADSELDAVHDEIYPPGSGPEVEG